MADPVEFRPGQIDQGDGRALATAMLAEISEIYGGVDLDAPGLPKAGPSELSPPGGTFLVQLVSPNTCAVHAEAAFGWWEEPVRQYAQAVLKEEK